MFVREGVTVDDEVGLGVIVFEGVPDLVRVMLDVEVCDRVFVTEGVPLFDAVFEGVIVRLGETDEVPVRLPEREPLIVDVADIERVGLTVLVGEPVLDGVPEFVGVTVDEEVKDDDLLAVMLDVSVLLTVLVGETVLEGVWLREGETVPERVAVPLPEFEAVLDRVAEFEGVLDGVEVKEAVLDAVKLLLLVILAVFVFDGEVVRVAVICNRRGPEYAAVPSSASERGDVAFNNVPSKYKLSLPLSTPSPNGTEATESTEESTACSPRINADVVVCKLKSLFVVVCKLKSLFVVVCKLKSLFPPP